MIQEIDHIVIVVRGLEAATADYSTLGFTVVPGGRHSGLNTRNALIAFADGCYFELIEFFGTAAPQTHWWYDRLQKGGGMVDFCVRSDNVKDDAGAFRSAGAEIGLPFAMDRERPDGYRVSWTLAVNEGQMRGLVPFFIRDITPREERLPREHRHPNGAVEIECLTMAVNSLDSIRSIYEKALTRSGETVMRPDLDAAGVQFTIGPHLLQFVAPFASSGLVSDWLRMRGPSPVEVKLRTSGKQYGLLDPARAHGARIVMA